MFKEFLTKRNLLIVFVVISIYYLIYVVYNDYLMSEKAEPNEIGADETGIIPIISASIPTPTPGSSIVPPTTTPPVSSSSGEPRTAHFSISEFACKDGTPVPKAYYPQVQVLMDNLEVLRAAMGGYPIHINSGYRTKKHNAAVGGKPQSLHLTAHAADIVIKGYTPAQIRTKIEALIKAGKMTQGGIGKYATFVHYDVRGYKARW